MIKAELITIGDELLIGQVINTNAAWIGQQLSLHGIETIKQNVISDQKEEILLALSQAKKRADIIIITGGLGPTKDDITKDCLCEFFNSKLILNEQALQNVKHIFESRNYKLTELNQSQAMIPEAAKYLHNSMGTAPGMWFHDKQQIFVSLPGVPYEMKHLISEEVLPRIHKLFKLPVILHKVIMTHGIGESFLSEIIAKWEDGLPDGFKLAYLPQPGMVRLRLTAKGSDRNKMETQIQEFILGLEKLIPEYIYGYDEKSLEEALGELLIENNLSLATAESCTGGYLGHLLTSIGGSSQYYQGGIISYSNQAKTDLLGINPALIEKNGAVSKEVAQEMAIGCKKRLKSSIGIASTGIAGPSGGNQEKPIGTVWIGIASEQGVNAIKYTFGDDRTRNIRRSALAALELVRKLILSQKNK